VSTGAGATKASKAFQEDELASIAEKAVAGERTCVVDMVEKGADVNGRSRSGVPLILWVLEQGSVDGFSILVDNGASVTASVMKEAGEESNQCPRVIDYVMRAPVEYLKVVLSNGFDPDYVLQPDTKESLLFTAISLHSLPHMECLLNAGATIDWRDSAGVTPVAKAQSLGDYELMWWLLEKGADPKLKDRWGYDVAANEKRFPRRQIDPAQKPWYDKVVAELEKRGLTAKP